MTKVTNFRATWVAVSLGCLGMAACGGGSDSTSVNSGTATSSSSSSSSSGGSPVVASGSIALSATSMSVAQSAGSVSVDVARSGDTSSSASASYQTQDGTAVAGTNYVAATGTLSWSAGDASVKHIAVSLSGAAFSGTKTFSVALKNAAGVTLGSPASATVTVDGSAAAATPGTVALTAGSDAVAQSAGSVTITVSRSGGSSGSASVVYATQNGTAMAGTDYTSMSGTLTWAAGDAANKTFNVVLGSTAFTGTKTFSIALSGVTGAALGTPTTATVTVTGSGASTGGPAAKLAAKLGTASRLLIGLGETYDTVKAQSAKIDILTAYLGEGDWTSWNSPPCDYACIVANNAHSLGAIPLFTQYQMANDGEDNMSAINDASFMTTYWSRYKTLLQDIAAFGHPALINLEPDFWGYTQHQSSDPTQVPAVVSSNADCSTLGNNVKGIAQCMVAMARKYAPNAYLGFPYSTWGANTDADVIAYMNAIGAQNADFIVQQTLDRDAGCFEAATSYCTRPSAGMYWDETNTTHPNFHDHLAQAQAYHTGIGNLPLIWWQTPEGVPSTTPGGTPGHFRDNREHYFLNHPAELTAAGGLAVVFSAGASYQTTIESDGGQYLNLSSQYLANPQVLP